MTDRRHPDGLPRGWLAPQWRERIVEPKIKDPEERARRIARANADLSLGPGANTIPRRGRRY